MKVVYKPKFHMCYYVDLKAVTCFTGRSTNLAVFQIFLSYFAKYINLVNEQSFRCSGLFTLAYNAYLLACLFTCKGTF